MNASHELLWTLCRKLPTDFTPYGERDRDTAEPCADCSCGCRHFVPLQGELGNDWGVCANPKSPRAGLLTFEHQGCAQFEDELEAELPAETAENSTASPAASPLPTTTPGRKVKIDFDEFQLALEGLDGLGEPIRHFLDTETGEVLALCREWEDYDELSERIDADFGTRYRKIEPLESHESFSIMEDFTASLPESRLKSRLLDALRRNKPFRHFKDAVHSDLALRDQWFAFRDDAHEARMQRWLKVEEINAEIIRRRS